MNQVLSVIKRIRLLNPVEAKNHSLVWLTPGDYKVRREFDKNRYLIETPDGLTLVQKSLTQEL